MMGWYGGWGVGSWIGMGLGMVLFWGLVVVAVVAVLRWSGGDRRDGVVTGAPVSGSVEPAAGAGSVGALATLQERFARGDLTEEEYRARRDVLLGR